MKKIVFFLIVCIISAQVQAQDITSENRVILPNGWALSPAGKSLPLGDLPLNMAISKSKKWMAITNNGQSTQTIQLINTAADIIEDNIVVDKAWLGLAFSKDEKYLYFNNKFHLIADFNQDTSTINTKEQKNHDQT